MSIKNISQGIEASLVAIVNNDTDIKFVEG